MKTSLYTALFTLSAYSAFAQRPVQGTVTDDKDEPLVGAIVRATGTTVVATADAAGRFALELPASASTLVVSFVGYESKEIPVSDQTSFTIKLSPSGQNLDEVVVVGYGTQRKSDLTGAVASVTNKALTQVATADPVQALQGHVAGVQITSNSGQPGAGTRIRVRGVGTINNSDPLYVVDGFQTGDISFLLPTDIESIEVLKDASATAIYGSRGANGVVVVTTKKGKIGKTKFDVSGFAGYQQIRKTLDVANASEYATLVTEAYENGAQPLPANFTDRFQQAIANNETGTDWQDFVTQKGFISNYNLNVSGGTEQNRYLISGGYFQQDGIVRNTGFKKYIIRLNDELVLTKRVKAGVSATFTHSSNQSSGGNVFSSALTANPITVPYTATGEYAYDDITSFTPNLARAINDQKYNTTRYNNLFANAYADVTLLEGLSFRSNFGIRYDNTNPKIYLPKYFIGPNDQRSISSLEERRTQNVAWVWSNFLNYNKTFGDAHNVSATLGQESQRTQFDGVAVTAFDVPEADALRFLTAARSPTPNIISLYPSDETLLSYFGRVNYGFKDRYLLTGTLRFDQSSKFLKEVRTGVFPSFGAAWRISEESFLKDVAVISQLKLRASWGRVGNQNAAPNYAYSARAINNQNSVFGGAAAPGIAVTRLTNNELKWESAVTTDVGLDAGFLDNKLSFTADYFDRRTEDMIALQPVADFIGRGPVAANVASLRNRGLELALDYRNSVGKFRYDVNVNLTAINNKITSLGGADPIASGNVISQIGNTTLTNVGREIAYFYGLQADGIFASQAEIDAYRGAAGLVQPNAKPGDVRYQDLNGDGVIDAKDKTYLGSATPKFTYGATLNLGYGGFDFRVLLYGVQGVEAINGQGLTLNKSSAFGGTWSNFYASRLDRWTPSNPGSSQPRVTSADRNGNDQFSSRHVENANYLRARNVELGYTIPTTFASRYGVGGLRVYASVDNLFTVTDYTGLDPEISAAGYYNDPLAYGVDFGNYPQPRTYRLGLSVQF